MILVTCGGTGGHIYPALAVARLLEQRGEKVRFIGSDTRMEKDKIPEAGFAFDGVPIQHLNKKTPFKSLSALWRSYQKSRRLLEQYQPEIVVGLGSYITVPTILAASRLNIPVALIETNRVPGKANQFLARFAKFVTLAYEETRAAFPNTPTHVVGSPVRPEFFDMNREEGAKVFGLSPEKKTLILLGGSLGAQKLNQSLISILPRLIKRPELQIVHVCGPQHFEAMKEQTLEYTGHPQYRLLHYVENMPALLACTDLAVSRAGASTLAELLACQVPSILVPGTFGGGHQKDNAETIQKGNAGLVLLEPDLNAEALFTMIEDVIWDTERLEQMQQNCSQLNPLNATETIVNLILKHTERQEEASHAQAL